MDYLCRETCGSCEWWQEFPDYDLFDAVSKGTGGGGGQVCEDLAGDVWISDRKGWQSCDWLAARPKWQDRVCQYWDVYEVCQKTCNHC